MNAVPKQVNAAFSGQDCETKNYKYGITQSFTP